MGSAASVEGVRLFMQRLSRGQQGAVLPMPARPHSTVSSHSGSSSSRTGHGEKRNVQASDADKLMQEEIMLLAARSATLNSTDIPVVADAPPCEYIKKELLGRGAFAETFMVHRQQDGAPCAAKFIDLSKLCPRDRVYAFSEIGCLASCDFFGVIAHFKSAICNGKVLIIVMEYADGGTLRKAVHERTLSETEIGLVFVQLMCSVHYIHSKRMIHRDIKTANILLTSNGLAKLGDFGFSQRYEESVSNEVAQSFLGTPYYLAPELWQHRRYGKRADIWACGIVLYEMLVGHRPFDAQNMKELGEKIITGTYEMPERISGDMKHLLQWILSPKPEHRPSAKAILQLPIMQHYLREFRGNIQQSSTMSQRDREKILFQLSEIEGSFSLPDETSGGTFEGPVFKMSAGQWKSRYLILADNSLTLTLPMGKGNDAAPTKERAKKIPVKVLTSVVPLPSTIFQGKEIHVFAINTGLRSVLIFGTTTLRDRDTWIHVLLKSLGMGA